MTRLVRGRLLNNNPERFQIIVTTEFRGHPGVLAGDYAPSPLPDALNHIGFELSRCQPVGIRTTQHPAARLDQGNPESCQIRIIPVRAEGRFPVPRKSRGIKHDPVKGPALSGKGPQPLEDIAFDPVMILWVEAIQGEIVLGPVEVGL